MRQKYFMIYAFKGVLSLVVMLILINIVSNKLAPVERVYSVGEVQAGLRYHNSLWVGRTVLVRVRFEMVLRSDSVTAKALFPESLAPSQGVRLRILLLPPTTDMPNKVSSFRQIPQLWASPHISPSTSNPVTAVLRRVPLLNQWILAVNPWDRVRTVRLKLLPTGGKLCIHPTADINDSATSCNDALLTGVSQ